MHPKDNRDTRSFKRPTRRIVVGIDAAWTSMGSSGVALVEVVGTRAVLVAVAPSYSAFCGLGKGGSVDWQNRRGTRFDAPGILQACKQLTGRMPDLIAIDMPLSLKRISQRRAADNLVSRAFGAMGAGTHSPSAKRPGAYGRRLQHALEDIGYVLQTADRRQTRERQLIEVYPHPALIRLCMSERRLPYKASKCARYWPNLAVSKRKESLHRIWGEIAKKLDLEIAGSQAAISEAIRTCRALKSVEDAIDALVSAWVGIRFLKREASSFGDSTAAIWIPA